MEVGAVSSVLLFLTVLMQLFWLSMLLMIMLFVLPVVYKLVILILIMGLFVLLGPILLVKEPMIKVFDDGCETSIGGLFFLVEEYDEKEESVEVFEEIKSSISVQVPVSVFVPLPLYLVADDNGCNDGDVAASFLNKKGERSFRCCCRLRLLVSGDAAAAAVVLIV